MDVVNVRLSKILKVTQDFSAGAFALHSFTPPRYGEVIEFAIHYRNPIDASYWLKIIDNRWFIIIDSLCWCNRKKWIIECAANFAPIRWARPLHFDAWMNVATFPTLLNNCFQSTHQGTPPFSMIRICAKWDRKSHNWQGKMWILDLRLFTIVCRSCPFSHT